MARLARVLQKIFGSSAGASQIAEFGSLAAGAPAFTTNPLTIQALGNYLTGWFGAVIGGNSPAIEDMNALHYLFSYQLAYLMQAGVAEYSATTTYFKGSLVNDGTGNVYTCLTDTSVGQALTNATKWRLSFTPVTGPDVIVGNQTTYPYATHATLAAAVADSNVGINKRVLLLDSQSIVTTISLTKAGWDISAMPGVVYTDGGAVTCISVAATSVRIRSLSFTSFTGITTAINFAAAGTFGRVRDCNFDNCANGVTYASVPGGEQPFVSDCFST